MLLLRDVSELHLLQEER